MPDDQLSSLRYLEVHAAVEWPPSPNPTAVHEGYMGDDGIPFRRSLRYRSERGALLVRRRFPFAVVNEREEVLIPPPGCYRRCLLRLAEAARAGDATKTDDDALLVCLYREGSRPISDDTATAIQVGVDALDRWCFSTAGASTPAVADACFHLAEHLLPYLDGAEPSFIARVRAVIIANRSHPRG